MSPRVLPLLGLLALTACPTFAVGPEAYELLERDPALCEAAELGPGPCSLFDLDNGTIFDNAQPQPLRLRFGFESPERNLAQLGLSYERPSQAPTELTWSFEVEGQPLPGNEALRLRRVVLSGTGDNEAQPVQTTAQGVLEVDLDIVANEPGDYAISMWLTDDNEFESPTVRWSFSVNEPARE
ncbi:MAG: hypothetical protein AAGF11_26270 [Myxococcota bacterium]